jgi:hypothetical protein
MVTFDWAKAEPDAARTAREIRVFFMMYFFLFIVIDHQGSSALIARHFI